MTSPNETTRRGFFAKLGLAFNGIVGLALGVPVLRYLASPGDPRTKTGIWLLDYCLGAGSVSRRRDALSHLS
jgi:hypothetical protein